jgi:hypothetical protein
MTSSSQSVTIDASLRYLAGPSIAAGLLVVLILFILSRFPSVLSLLAFSLLSAAVAAGLACEIVIWIARGARRIEVHLDELILYRGRLLAPTRIQRVSVTGLRVSSRLGRRSATLRVASTRTLRIFGDAFRDEDFARVLSALQAWTE